MFKLSLIILFSFRGERFAFGHHYLRPHETYHEPTRKFYPNEVMRVPLYEIISLDLIWARCWVLDPMTYCKGRPIEAVEEHVYICEYRVDKTAHLFYKISKSQSRANLCLKSYAFETFETRLKPVRTYTVCIALYLGNWYLLHVVFVY